MLDIHVIVCNMYAENCYIISDEAKECVIIDCGALREEERNAVTEYISKNQLKPVHLIVTHGHADHNFGDSFILKTYGLKPEINQMDQYLLDALPEQANFLTHGKMRLTVPEVGEYLKQDDKIAFGNHEFTVMETPGHSPGCVCFYCPEENVLMSGDTLFRRSIGRTDLPGGSMFELIQSLRLLSQLPDQTKVCPGHGETTTIGDEVAFNPYMDR